MTNLTENREVLLRYMNSVSDINYYALYKQHDDKIERMRIHMHVSGVGQRR